MALMNLLKANFTGSVGDVTGANWKGKPIVKARIFSKAPPTSLQTNSVRSFEALNRISGTIAKLGFAQLGLSAKNLLPHNAVSKFLKPIIKDHIFAPANAEAKIPNDGSLRIINIARETSTSTVTINIDLGPDYIPMTGSWFYLLFFDQSGKVYFSSSGDPQEKTFSFYLPFSPDFVYNTMIFLSDPATKGRLLHGFQIQEGLGMQYSLNEQLTPDTWLDGRPIYQKTIVKSGLGSDTTTNVPHGITNLDMVISIEGMYNNSPSNTGNTQLSYSKYYGSGYNRNYGQFVSVNKTNLQLIQENNHGNIYTAYVTIKYIKNV